jgi:hypothetical protein
MSNIKNKDLDALLCLLDGKITMYRIKNMNKDNTDIILIQNAIQYLYNKNIGGN